MDLIQPTMRSVPPKILEQQDIQALHRVRQRIVNHRTATVCQIRGLLLDHGITIGAAVSRVHRAVPLILEDAENALSARMHRTIEERYDLFNDLGRRINFFDKEIDVVFKESEAGSTLPKLKVLVLKQPRPLLLLLEKELNLKMVVTLPHGWVWFRGSTQVATGKCW